MNSNQTDKIVYGIHVVETLLKKNPSQILELIIVRDRQNSRVENLLKTAHTHHIPVRFVTSNEFANELSDAEVVHQSVAARLKSKMLSTESELFELLETLKEPPFLLILDQVQDPHNLGACLRSAAFFGVHAVIVPKDRSAPMTPVVHKVASGGAEMVPVIFVSNLARTMENLKKHNIWIVGATEHADQTITELDLKGPLAIVLGAEGQGLRRLTQESCDFLAKIPSESPISSLNVSVATGIFLFAAFSKRNQ